MKSNRTFHWTLCVSLACHVALLIIVPGLKVFSLVPVLPPVITFVSLPATTKAVVSSSAISPPTIKGPRQPGKSALPKPREKPAREKKEVSQPAPAEKTLPQEQKPVPAAPQRQSIAAARPLPTPVSIDDAAQSGMYTNYYKIINDQLQRAALSPADFAEGQITLSFVVMADGSLVSVDVVPDSSTPDSTLQQTAVQIVRDASPFPPFPRDLRKIDLTFNVVICFREQT